jgi:enoyl-CoA hydratase/carnithine racemase
VTTSHPPTAEPRELAGGKLRLDHPAPHVARLTIDNPAKRNALDHDILDAFAAVLPELDARCLLITATGPVFSAGYDIGGLPRDEFAHRAAALVAHPFHDAIAALDAFPFPAVAALNGHAIGGGLELALSCDLRLASQDAKLGMPPARLGLVYSHTGLRKFVDVIGAARTRELFFTARNVTAETAERWGLVNEVMPAGELADRAVECAAGIGALAPLAQCGNKRVLGALLAAEGEVSAETERELVALREACFRSEDFYEGVRAFAEKRRPRWRGE